MAKINADKCTGCKNCLIFCPDGAINYKDGKCSVDSAVCTECFVCIRRPVCPEGAFEKTPIESMLKQFQHSLSDPSANTPIKKGLVGRGGQEVKTVDVDNTLAPGTIRMTIDVGRPGVGCYMYDVEKILMAVTKAGAQLPPGSGSPLALVLEDRATGKLSEECLPYHVHSLIIEATFPDTDLNKVVKAMQSVEKDINTVFTVGLTMHVDDENCWNKALDRLDDIGFPKPYRGKVNMGLGRPYPPKL